MTGFEKIVSVAALTGAATLGVGIAEGGTALAHTVDIYQIAPKCSDGLYGKPEIEVDFIGFGDQIGNVVTTDATNTYHYDRTVTAENESKPLYIQAAVGKITVTTIWPNNKEEKTFDIQACETPTTVKNTTTTVVETTAATTTTIPRSTTTIVETTAPVTTTPAETTAVVVTTPKTTIAPTTSLALTTTTAEVTTTTAAPPTTETATTLATATRLVTPTVKAPPAAVSPLPNTGSEKETGNTLRLAGLVTLIGAACIKFTRRKLNTKA